MLPVGRLVVEQEPHGAAAEREPLDGCRHGWSIERQTVTLTGRIGVMQRTGWAHEEHDDHGEHGGRPAHRVGGARASRGAGDPEAGP